MALVIPQSGIAYNAIESAGICLPAFCTATSSSCCLVALQTYHMAMCAGCVSIDAAQGWCCRSHTARHLIHACMHAMNSAQLCSPHLNKLLLLDQSNVPVRVYAV
jgi:hypothetical protein